MFNLLNFSIKSNIILKQPLYQYTNLPQLYDLIVEKPSPELPIRYAKYLTPIYRKMMKKNPVQRPTASELLQE